MPAFLGIRNEAARQEGSTGIVSLWLKVLVVPEDAAGGGLYPNSRCVEGYFKVGMHLFLTTSSCRIVEPSSDLNYALTLFKLGIVHAWVCTFNGRSVDCISKRSMVTASNSDGCSFVPLLVGLERLSLDCLDTVAPGQVHWHQEWNTDNLRLFWFCMVADWYWIIEV